MTRLSVIERLKSPAATFAIALPLALVATLSGCVGTPVITPTPSHPTSANPTSAGPTSSPSAAPTPTTEPADAPTVRFDLGCDDFYSAATLASLFSDSVIAQTPAQSAAVGERQGLTVITRAQQDGGLFCSWSNGKPTVDSTGRPGDGQAASVTVYPDASARWKGEAYYYGLTSNTQQHCNPGAKTSCYLDALRNGYVVHTEIEHIRLKTSKPGAVGSSAPPTAVREIFAAILSKLAQAGTPRPAWKPSVQADPSPENCEAYVTGKQVQTALGVNIPVGLERPDGGVPVAEDASIYGCGFLTRLSDSGYGVIRWLHEGSAALTKAIAEHTTPAVTPFAVDGLQPGDSATIGRSGKELYVDLSIGGNWIELKFFRPQNGIPKPAVADTAYAKAIAHDVVANLNP